MGNVVAVLGVGDKTSGNYMARNMRRIEEITANPIDSQTTKTSGEGHLGTGKSNRSIKIIQERSRLFGHLEALEVVFASVNSTIFDLTSETGEKALKDEILLTPRLSGPELNRNRSYKEGGERVGGCKALPCGIL